MSTNRNSKSKKPIEVSVPSPSKSGIDGIYTKEIIERRREKTAMWLSIVIIGVFALTILATLVALLWINQSRLPSLLDFVKVLLPVEAALLGTAFGFYFSQSRLKNRD